MSVDVRELLSEGEHTTLECKRATNSVPNSVWDTYSAFANTNGGTILLGVDENKDENGVNRFTITGVCDSEKIRKDLWNIVNNKEKVSANLLHDKDIQVVDAEGKLVVVIRVPQASYSMRPIYINNNITRGTFKRGHEGDYHCTEQDIKMMVRDSNELGNDGMLLEYYTMDDIDIPTLEGYRQMFQTQNPNHYWNSYTHTDFLKHLSCFAKDRQTGKE